jgi:hypothetical protein
MRALLTFYKYLLSACLLHARPGLGTGVPAGGRRQTGGSLCEGAILTAVRAMGPPCLPRELGKASWRKQNFRRDLKGEWNEPRRGGQGGCSAWLDDRCKGPEVGSSWLFKGGRTGRCALPGLVQDVSFSETVGVDQCRACLASEALGSILSTTKIFKESPFLFSE